jgi:hypothetical protein
LFEGFDDFEAPVISASRQRKASEKQKQEMKGDQKVNNRRVNLYMDDFYQGLSQAPHFDH